MTASFIMTITLVYFKQILTIAAFSIWFCDASSDMACIQSERQALLQLKHDLKDPAGRLSSWIGGDCCKWPGVVCHNLTGHVLGIHLRNPYDNVYYETYADYGAQSLHCLGGKINPAMLNLNHLNYLDLSSNDFEGIPIPNFIGSLVNLKYLNLSQAGFGGPIPRQLGNLSALGYLDLSDSALLRVENLQWLSGLSLLQHLDMSWLNLRNAFDWMQVMMALPSLVELHLSSCELGHIPSQTKTNFTSLAILDLSFNHFNYLIVGWAFRLGSLVSLDISANDINGPIPHGLENMTSLTSLDLSSNSLNSSLPRALFVLNGIVSLNLGDNAFDLGPIPSGLKNMTSLRDLDLSRNSFNSTIPNWIYGIRGLEFLDLWGNCLQGAISGAVGNLNSLVRLDLSWNQLGGGIPRSLGKLCSLKEVYLSWNGFVGDVAEVLKSFSGCVSNGNGPEQLDLNSNKLSGHLPDQLGQFKNLARLLLHSNSIFGPIPKSIGRLSSLRALDLGINKLNGTLPKSFGELVKLEALSISRNMLAGVVSEAHFTNLTRLRLLYANGNKLILKLSNDWVPPFQLEEIYLSSWQLGSQFPIWLQSQRNLWNLDISNTGLSDTIPSWFKSFSSQFTYLNLSHNKLHGEISSLTEFLAVDLSSNNFTGQLPVISSDAKFLDLSNNFFSGFIGHFLCKRVEKSNALKILNLGNNLLSGKIPDCRMHWPMLKAIRLENNNLMGKFPSSMALLTSLESLHLRNNHLSGPLLVSLQNCTKLLVLDLSGNEFMGRIPTWIGTRLLSLMVLSLRSNKFQGDIPYELCGLTSLQILDLADNNLSGIIPKCFNNFSAMAQKHHSPDPIYYTSIDIFAILFQNALLVMKGIEVEYSTTLQLVTSLDLSENHLFGDIPNELTSLVGLLYLNLSMNALTGRIPERIDAMRLLESLDLHSNQLFGEIPSSMSNSTFLSYLNLSYNNLMGKIPSSTQLQSFDNTSFIGNKLCGLPLTEDCSENGLTPEAGHVGEEVDGFEVKWFFLGMALGFGVGFWGFVGPILFNKSWRIAYFRFLNIIWRKLCGVGFACRCL